MMFNYVRRLGTTRILARDLCKCCICPVRIVIQHSPQLWSAGPSSLIDQAEISRACTFFNLSSFDERLVCESQHSKRRESAQY